MFFCFALLIRTVGEIEISPLISTTAEAACTNYWTRGSPKFIAPVREQCMCLFYAPPESMHLATWLPVFLLNSTRCGIVLSVLSRPVDHTGGLCRRICFPREPSPAERPVTAHGSLMGLGWAFSLTAWALHLPPVRRSGRIRARTGSSGDPPFTVRFPRPWMSDGQVCGAVVPRRSERGLYDHSAAGGWAAASRQAE